LSEQSDNHERDIVLIGGSFGAIDSLSQVLKDIPENFPGSMLVVIHTGAEGPGMLPSILSRSGALPAVRAKDGEPMRPGKVYVAPPDRHLILDRGDILRVRKGPRENGFRPAIDPLFRSASSGGYGPRSVAVVLSGYLDDGAAGMFAVRRQGGLGIVQDPEAALAGDMPAHALQYGGADFVLPTQEIGPKLVDLVRGSRELVTVKKRESGSRVRGGNGRSDPAGFEHPPNSFVAFPNEGEGTPSVFACPECHGVLWEIKEGGSVRYRCRTGHAYSEGTLNEELSRAGETALWAAMRALEEKASMARKMAGTVGGPGSWKERLSEQASTYAQHAEILRRMILGEPIDLSDEAERSA
jgi:two-component system, chemotaxis family, protein-glutamate methylesterase/glutaminase